MDKPPSAEHDSARRSGFVRVLGFTFDRLVLRLASGIALSVIVPPAIALYTLSQRQFDRGIDARRRAAESENRILEVALRHRMLERDATLEQDVPWPKFEERDVEDLAAYLR